MLFILYYWKLVLFAVSGAWRIAELVAAVLALVCGYIAWKHPDWESTMKNPLWMIPLGLFLLILIVRLITAPYAMHAEDQKTIADLKKIVEKKEQDTKQDIRSFLESLHPDVLAKVDAGEKQIGVWLGPVNQTKLATLSERQGFSALLSVKSTNQIWMTAGEAQRGDFIRPTGENGTLVGYYLYPKDALIK
jgi:hypothetical protein